MQKRVLMTALALTMTGLTGNWALADRPSQDLPPQEMEQLQANGIKFQKLGVIPQADLVRLRLIMHRANKIGAISADDFDYVLQKAKDPCVSSTSPGYVHLISAGTFTYLKTYAPDQKERIMNVCLPLISSANLLDQRIGLRVAEHLRDRRAMARALTLLKSPDSMVRERASAYLSAVGPHAQG